MGTTKACSPNKATSQRGILENSTTQNHLKAIKTKSNKTIKIKTIKQDSDLTVFLINSITVIHNVLARHTGLLILTFLFFLLAFFSSYKNCSQEQ